MGEWEDREQDIKNMVDNETRIKQLIETGYKNYSNLQTKK